MQHNNKSSEMMLLIDCVCVCVHSGLQDCLSNEMPTVAALQHEELKQSWAKGICKESAFVTLLSVNEKKMLH